MKSLSDEELLYVLRNGIYTKLKGYDTKLTHYNVIGFCDNEDELLISYGSISWYDAESNYMPHIIKGKDKNKKWFINK